MKGGAESQNLAIRLTGVSDRGAWSNGGGAVGLAGSDPRRRGKGDREGGQVSGERVTTVGSGLSPGRTCRKRLSGGRLGTLPTGGQVPSDRSGPLGARESVPRWLSRETGRGCS